MDEKQNFSFDTDLASPTTLSAAGSTKDEALVFLEQHKLAANSELWHDEAYIKSLRKKVDRHVIPFFFFCYVLNFLDKILLNYYTRSEQATRFGLWYMGIGGGQILGGLVSYLFQFISPHAPLSGWRVMFLVLGLISVALGAAMFFFVPDSPMRARFLSEEEKIALLEHVKRNQTGIENPHFHPKQILEALLGVQYWGTALIVILQTISSGVTSTYSASLIKGFGYSSKQAALLGMPSGAITIISCLFCGMTGSRFGHRWLITVIVTVPSILGAALMSWLPKSQKGGLLAGIYLVNFVVGSTPLMYQWLVGNTAGHTKRTFTAGSLNAAFAIGSIIGPQTFQARDAPGYQPAKITLVVSFSMSAVVATLLFLYYFMVNKRRAGEALLERDAADVDENKAYAGLTDKQNRSFRYTY
ncbi:MAG: hypothetical protein Q9165_005169 [Trypethelium subeluteriae]